MQDVQQLSDAELLALIGPQTPTPRPTPAPRPVARQEAMRPSPLAGAPAPAPIAMDGLSDLGQSITGDDTPEQIAAKMRASGAPESEITSIMADLQNPDGVNPDLAAMTNEELKALLADGSPDQFAPDQSLYNTGPGVVDFDLLPPEMRNTLKAGQRVLMPADAPGQPRQIVTLSQDMNIPVRQPMAGEPVTEFGGGSIRGVVQGNPAEAFVTAASEQIPGLDEAAAGVGGLLTGRGFDATRQDQMLTRELLNRTNPLARDVGGIVGAVAPALLPIGAAANFVGRGATLGGMTGRGARAAAVAAPVGAVMGFGNTDGDFGERAQASAVSGLLSAAAAPVGVAAVEGLGAAASGIGGLLRRGAMTPEARADTRVASALERALARDEITPRTLLSNLDDLAPGRLPFEAGGENLRGLAEVGAQAPGRTRSRLVTNLTERSDEATNRVSDMIGEAFGARGNVFQQLRQRRQERTLAANAGMDSFGDRQVELGDKAVQALRQGLSSRAVRDEAINAAAELTPEGQVAANRLFGLGDDVLDNPEAARLTIREAQDISFTLKEAASRAFRGGFNTRGKALQNLSEAVRGAARQDSDYAKWLKDFGDASDSIEALRQGRNLFAQASEKNATSAAELREAWDAMSDASRDNFRLGIGEAILDKVRSQGGVTIMRRLLKDHEIADRARIAFGSDAAFQAFMKRVDQEVDMQNVTNRVLSGSQSGFRIAGAADLRQDGSVDLAEVAGMAEGGLVGAASKGLKMALRRLPRQDRSVLGNDRTNAILADALNDPEAMRRLLTMTAEEQERINRASQGGILRPRPISSTTGVASGLLAAQTVN